MKRKKKSKKKIFIISLVIIFIVMGGICYFIITKTNVFTYKNKITIESGDKVPLVSDYLYKDNDKVMDIVWEDDFSSDGKVYKPGTYKGVFSYKGEDKNIILVVKDTKSPTISGVHDIVVTAFTNKPDLLEGISASDNSMEDIEVNVKGEYNIEEVGEYNLSYVAKDSSGNETIKEFKVTVKENENVSVSKTSNGHTIKNYYGITYVDDVIIANKSYSLPSNFAPNKMVYINGYIRVVDYVKDAFLSLTSSATSAGLNIYASSGYRSYSDQNYIYNNYVKLDGKENADTYSARAGYSEHQTGLAIDVNSVDMSFDNTNESIWLRENAYLYGFIIRYPKGKEDITGYMYEPWHIRYVGKDLASKLYNNGNYITLEEYFGIDSKYK